MTVGVAGLIVSGVGAVAGAAIGANAAKDAAKQNRAGMDAATEEQARQYDQTREDWAPWREAGEWGLDQMRNADTAFETSPGYEWRLGEGNRALQNQFSNRSGGGNAMRALVDYNQNFASNEFGNWWGRMSNMSGQGQTATSGTAMAGMNAANNNSSTYMRGAENDASLTAWNAGNTNNMLQGGLSNSLYWAKQKWGQPTDNSWLQPIDTTTLPAKRG